MKIKLPHPVALKNQALVQTKTLYYMIKRSLEVKLPTLSTDGKAEVGRIREEKRREDQRRERVTGKKMQVRENVENTRFTCFFPMICRSRRVEK